MLKDIVIYGKNVLPLFSTRTRRDFIPLSRNQARRIEYITIDDVPRYVIEILGHVGDQFIRVGYDNASDT